MKRCVVPLILFLFSFFCGTGPASARLTVFPPEEMPRQAGIILAGEVVEIRESSEPPEFVVETMTVYKGGLGWSRIGVPLPESGGPGTETIALAPAIGTQLLLFLSVNESGRLVPAADLNWAALLEDGQVRGLYMGGNVQDYSEGMYVAAFNAFLAETPGTRVQPPKEAGEIKETKKNIAPGTVNPAFFFLLAGVSLLAIIITARLRRPSQRLQKIKKDLKG